jgi:hypothetical protein
MIKKLPKIGKRGWFGVFCIVAGLSTMAGITGHETGNTRTEQWFNANDNGGQMRRMAEDVTAELQGYGSASDKRQHEGLSCLAFGSALVFWGYRKYNPKKQTLGSIPAIDAKNEVAGSISKSPVNKNIPGSIEQ